MEEKALHEDHDYSLDEKGSIKACAEPVEDSVSQTVRPVFHEKKQFFCT